jgi:hypothetical protein
MEYKVFSGDWWFPYADCWRKAERSGEMLQLHKEITHRLIYMFKLKIIVVLFCFRCNARVWSLVAQKIKKESKPTATGQACLGTAPLKKRLSSPGPLVRSLSLSRRRLDDRRRRPRSSLGPSPATSNHQVRPPLLVPSCCAKPSTQTLTSAIWLFVFGFGSKF